MPFRIIWILLIVALLPLSFCLGETEKLKTAMDIYSLASHRTEVFERDYPELARELYFLPFLGRYKNLSEKNRLLLIEKTGITSLLIHQAASMTMVKHELSYWEPEILFMSPPYIHLALSRADVEAEELWKVSRLLQWRAWALMTGAKQTEGAEILMDLWTMGQRLDYGYSPFFLQVSRSIRQDILENFSAAFQEGEGLDESTLRRINGFFSKIKESGLDRGRWMRQIIEGHLYQLRFQMKLFEILASDSRKAMNSIVLKRWLKSARSEEEAEAFRKKFKEKMEFLLCQEPEKKLLELKQFLEKVGDAYDSESGVEERIAELSAQEPNLTPYHKEILEADIFQDSYNLKVFRKQFYRMGQSWQLFLDYVNSCRQEQ